MHNGSEKTKRDAIFGVSHRSVRNWPSQKSIYPFLRACVYCEPFSHWTILYSVRTKPLLYIIFVWFVRSLICIKQSYHKWNKHITGFWAFSCRSDWVTKAPPISATMKRQRRSYSRIFRHPWPSTVCSWVLSRTNILTEFLLGILSSITWTWQDLNPSIPSSYLQIW